VLITIDGPAGAGKSTVARALARELGYSYLDSGAMYRCVALLSLAEPNEPPALLARDARIEMDVAGPDGQPRVLLDGRDVTEAIRALEVSEASSRIAADPEVRRALVAKQRDLLCNGDWVAEGRDVGTIVAPQAELKIFLTAEAHERARRRAAELGADPQVVLAEQALRDERDITREHGPLRPAPDAVTIDTTGLDVRQVLERIVALVREAPCAAGSRGSSPRA
jgi:cytidylate kinase